MFLQESVATVWTQWPSLARYRSSRIFLLPVSSSQTPPGRFWRGHRNARQKLHAWQEGRIAQPAATAFLAFTAPGENLGWGGVWSDLI